MKCQLMRAQPRWRKASWRGVIALVADEEASVAVEPGEVALGHPAVPAQLLARVDTAAGDSGGDAPTAQCLAAPPMPRCAVPAGRRNRPGSRFRVDARDHQTGYHRPDLALAALAAVLPPRVVHRTARGDARCGTGCWTSSSGSPPARWRGKPAVASVPRRPHHPRVPAAPNGRRDPRWSARDGKLQRGGPAAGAAARPSFHQASALLRMSQPLEST